MAKKDKILTGLSILFAVILLLLVVFYNPVYMAIGGIVSFLIAIPIIGAVAVFIVCFWRLLYTMNDPEKFSGKILYPIITDIICMVLVIIIAMPISNGIKEAVFRRKQADFLEFALKHQNDVYDQYPALIPLSNQEKDLSVTANVQVFSVQGKNCFLFYTLDTPSRSEGYLYLPEDKLFYGVYEYYSNGDEKVYTENFSLVSFDKVG